MATNGTVKKEEDVDDEATDFGKIVADYLERIDALNGILPLFTVLLGAFRDTERKRFKVFLDAKCQRQNADTGDEVGEYRVPNEYVREFRRHTGKISKADAAGDIVPEVFLVALVAQFDAFLSRLLRCIHLKKPDCTGSA